MEDRKRTTYLRRERKTWALSQQELAELIGYRCPDHLSRVERGVRKPNRELLLACYMLFGLTAEKLFPELFADIEERIVRRVYQLVQRLEGDTRPSSRKKREFANRILKRAVNRLKKTPKL